MSCFWPAPWSGVCHPTINRKPQRPSHVACPLVQRAMHSYLTLCPRAVPLRLTVPYSRSVSRPHDQTNIPDRMAPGLECVHVCHPCCCVPTIVLCHLAVLMCAKTCAGVHHTVMQFVLARWCAYMPTLLLHHHLLCRPPMFGGRRVLGVHAGFWFYTVGQRGGIKLSGGPWWVGWVSLGRFWSAWNEMRCMGEGVRSSTTLGDNSVKH